MINYQRFFSRYDMTDIGAKLFFLSDDESVTKQNDLGIKILNVSVTGILLQSKTPLELGKVKGFQLELGVNRFALMGDVVWNSLENDFHYTGIKLKFTKKSIFVKWFNFLRQLDFVMQEDGTSKKQDTRELELKCNDGLLQNSDMKFHTMSFGKQISV